MTLQRDRCGDVEECDPCAVGQRDGGRAAGRGRGAQRCRGGGSAVAGQDDAVRGVEVGDHVAWRTAGDHRFIESELVGAAAAGEGVAAGAGEQAVGPGAADQNIATRRIDAAIDDNPVVDPAAVSVSLPAPA